MSDSSNEELTMQSFFDHKLLNAKCNSPKPPKIMFSCNPRIALFLMIIILLSLTFPCAARLLFNYTSFTPNIHELIYSGDATSSEPVIQLTRNQNDKGMEASTGRVTYSKPLHLWDKASEKLADFTTHFSFVINSQYIDTHGDGIAFFLAPVNFSVPHVQEGSGIGLVSGNQMLNSSLNPFVAVEFDTYHNLWDPVDDHVGININSMRSVKNVTWKNLVPFGQLNTAKIDYNSSLQRLSVVFTAFEANRTSLQHLTAKLDLSEYLPEWVTFGFSASTGDFFEIHTLNSWDFSTTLEIGEGKVGPTPAPSPTLAGSETVSETPKPRQNGRKNKKIILGLGLGLPLLTVIIGLSFLLFGVWKKRSILSDKTEKHVFDVSEQFGNETGPKKFSYKELAIATKKFGEEEKIGEGGFGGVYKGFLRELNCYVAVKRVSKGSKQGVKEYASEVKTISRLRHRNLVKLIGWCHEDRELLLVYEFMSKGSLDSHLFKGQSLLTGVMRYNIARGLASALFYLHEEWEQCVLHRDIKSSNIMLDSNFNAKLGDFGLARLVEHGKGSQTTILAGTMGYMAPESVLTGKASKGSDVYSFGVVALELASGRKPIDSTAKESQIRLVDQVWELYGRGKLLDAVDPKLGNDYDERQIERLMIVGLWCAHPDQNIRPSIKQAIQVLDFVAPLPILPSTIPMPTYLASPINMSAFWHSPPYEPTQSDGEGLTQFSGSTCNASSTKLTDSSSASSSSALLFRTQ